MKYIYKIILNNPRKAVAFTFFFLFSYQMLSAFLGFELCDSGFYMTFYEYIFTDPECIEYNFMYYLTGLIGGGFIKLFPDSGLIGMRFLGIITNMVVIYSIYKFYKNKISLLSILLGLTLVVISYIAMPMTFYHDLLTCLLFVLSVIWLLKGIEKKSFFFIILSGFITASNIFVRIPNLLDYSIIILFILHYIYEKECFRLCLKRCIIFTIAYILGIISILILMKYLGHYQYFINIINELISIGTDNSGNNSHGILHMISSYLDTYNTIIRFGIKLLFLYFLIMISTFIIQKKYLLYPLYILSSLGLIYIISLTDIMVTLYVFSIIGLVGNIIYSKNYMIKLMTWAGLLMMLIIPIGSDGMFNNGSIIYWLALPMSISFFTNLKNIFMSYRMTRNIPIQKILIFTLSVYFIICMVKMLNNGCYFDDGSLLTKRFQIENQKIKNIFTSQERAKIINELLEGIQPYINKNNYLFAYGSIPMINYLTKTKPFLGCSWPEQFSAQILQSKLNNYKGSKPIILRQKFNSIGGTFGIPNDNYLNDCGKETGILCTNEKNRIINQYIKDNNYKNVFENDFFILLIP